MTTNTKGTPLELERRDQPNETRVVPVGAKSTALITPMVNEDYWLLRVRLSDHQAVIGFPKFNTIGIGFAQEEDDWNTNLPFRCHPDDIVEHIWVNRGDEAITKEMVKAAVEMIQEAASELAPDEAELPPIPRMSEFREQNVHVEVIDLRGEEEDEKE